MRRSLVDLPFQSGADLHEIGSDATLTLPQHALMWLAGWTGLCRMTGL